MSISSTLANLDAYLLVSLRLTVPYSHGCLSLYVSRISLAAKKLSNGPRKHKFGRDYHPERQSKPIPSRVPLLQWRYIRMDRSPGANDGRRNAAADNIKQSVTATSSRAACRRASTAYGDQKQIDEHFFRGIRGVLWCFWLSFYMSLVRWHHHCY